VKGIIFSKNIPIGCREYPPHKPKEFRVLILTVDLAPFFHCREKPSKKASSMSKQTKKHLISKGYMTHRKLAYHLLIARVE
jgi:hypothetical protein